MKRFTISDRGLRVEFVLGSEYRVWLPDAATMFRPNGFAGGTGVDLRDGQLVFGELSRNFDGMLLYSEEQTAKFSPAVRMAVECICRIALLKHFGRHEDWCVQINDQSITLQYANWDSKANTLDLVHDLVEKLYDILCFDLDVGAIVST